MIKDENWTPISNTGRIWCFLGIFLVMSVIQMLKLFDYWSQSSILGNQIIKKIMRRERFMKIKHYFHILDGETEGIKMKNHSVILKI